MNGKYILNKTTGVLHTEALCPFTKNGIPSGEHIGVFDAEESAYSSAGKKIRLCMRCEAKKAQFLRLNAPTTSKPKTK